MDIFKTFATNPDKEIHGAWVDLKSTLAEGEQRPRILVARLGNRLHSRMMTALFKKNQKDLNSTDDELASKVDEDLNIEVTAKTILLGWENLEYAGETIEYNLDNAMKLLKIGDFRNLVLAHARNFENFRAEQEDATKKG